MEKSPLNLDTKRSEFRREETETAAAQNLYENPSESREQEKKKSGEEMKMKKKISSRFLTSSSSSCLNNFRTLFFSPTVIYLFVLLYLSLCVVCGEIRGSSSFTFTQQKKNSTQNSKLVDDGVKSGYFTSSRVKIIAKINFL